ncbi:hypothetical protein [Edaphobacter flagellatus]|uniref:hypothetical protein n=1 Tax=Edaphobacter flagellatus TaxID=1933044 RepID=UPI0021B29280|nr:hypothetical protein [Edaphobacter flagellatus]
MLAFRSNALDRSYASASLWMMSGGNGLMNLGRSRNGTDGVIALGNMRFTRAPAATSSDTCTQGDSWDAVSGGTPYHFYCSATNQIVRVQLTTW